MGFKDVSVYTKEYILSCISEEDIFIRYLNINPDISYSYTNPFRTDTRAGCRFYYDSRGVLKFNDFSRKENIDCFNVVQKIYNCSYYKALKIIAKDFGLIENNSIEDFDYTLYNPPKIEKKKTVIRITIRDWNTLDLNFWNKYHINEVYDTKKYLKFMQVYPCKSIWINDYYYKCKSNDPCYAYYFGKDENGIDNFKIYFPFRSYNKFIQNEPNLLQGYDKLPDIGEKLLITKSYKDVLCLRLFKIYSVAPTSETVLITPEDFSDLYNRFDNIYSLMDNDKIGKHMSYLLRKNYEITPLLFPKDMKKDFSDNLENLGIVEMQEMINYYEERL